MAVRSKSKKEEIKTAQASLDVSPSEARSAGIVSATPLVRQPQRGARDSMSQALFFVRSSLDQGQ
jgi:hypothetical protein